MTKYQLVTNTGKSASSTENRLRTIDNDTLLKLYDDAKDWLVKHQVKADTNNQIDESGKPYNHEKYQKYLRLLEKIELEGRRRKIVPFIPIETIRKIFDIPEENI